MRLVPASGHFCVHVLQSLYGQDILTLARNQAIVLEPGKLEWTFWEQVNVTIPRTRPALCAYGVMDILWWRWHKTNRSTSMRYLRIYAPMPYHLPLSRQLSLMPYLRAPKILNRRCDNRLAQISDLCRTCSATAHNRFATITEIEHQDTWRCLVLEH